MRFAWLTDVLWLFLGLGLVAIMVWWARGARGSVNGFVIQVDGEDVRFSGKFPPGMQGTVADFLRDDVGIQGAYQIRGVWEGDGPTRRLVVVVRGAQARPMEQRIRNFLKLNIKPPRN